MSDPFESGDWGTPSSGDWGTPATGSTYGSTIAPSQGGRTKATLSLVLGIVALVLPIPVLDLAAGIIGIVLGVQARREGGGGLATAGFVVSIIGTILAAMFTIGVLFLGGVAWNVLPRILGQM